MNTCRIKICGDTTLCEACGLEWDTNDPREPVCKMKRLFDDYEAGRKRYAALELAALTLAAVVLVRELLAYTVSP